MGDHKLVNEDYVYIAAPFFNSAQLEIVQTIEQYLDASNIRYYSPRIHSGSALLTTEQKKDFDAWTPVLQSNIRALHDCHVMIAVLEYAFPKGVGLSIVDSRRFTENGTIDWIPTHLELPDNGVVFEVGYLHALNGLREATYAKSSVYGHRTPIIGFHTEKGLEEMNLMLSHTIDGMICGYSDLHSYIVSGDLSVIQRYKGKVI